jgi:Tfp pilus assembly protein PilN
MELPSLKSVLLGKQYIGIEHFTLRNEEKVALILVEHTREGLIVAQKDRVSYADKIADKWDRKLPYFIVVNTNQVIHKEVSGTDIVDEKLLHKAFPNTNWDDFYYEIWRLQSKSVIAITRKSYIRELVASYKNEKILVAGVSLGVGSAAEIMQFSDQSQLATNHQLISIEKDHSIISEHSKEGTITYIINELQIENRQLLAFSGVLRLIRGETVNTGSVIAFSAALNEHFQQESLFSKMLKGGVGLILAILLVNFLFFSHYYEAAQETEENVIVNKTSIESFKKVKERITIKEERYNAIGRKNVSQSSVVINEIASKVPEAIALTEMVFEPLDKKVKTGEKIQTEEGIILVKGVTLSNNAVTQWIEALENLHQIKKVNITHFGKNEANETVFSIRINLK